jgi:hypothetical protein
LFLDRRVAFNLFGWWLYWHIAVTEATPVEANERTCVHYLLIRPCEKIINFGGE